MSCARLWENPEGRWALRSPGRLGGIPAFSPLPARTTLVCRQALAGPLAGAQLFWWQPGTAACTGALRGTSLFPGIAQG